jgi:hypothetical protein
VDEDDRLTRSRSADAADERAVARGRVEGL